VKIDELEAKAGDMLIKTWEKSNCGIVDENMMAVIYNCHQYARIIIP
jgi:hypothetical protein